MLAVQLGKQVAPVGSRSATTPAPVEFPIELESVRVADGSALDELTQKNQTLRREVDRLVAELAKRERATAATPSKIGQDRIGRNTTFWLDRYFHAEQRGEFLGGLDELIQLALYVAENRETGIRRLVEIVGDVEQESAGRERALHVLSLFPSELALETILEAYTGQVAPDEDWEWELFKWQIEGLPVSALEPYLEDFHAHLQKESASDGLSKEGFSVCAQLALRHGHEPSRDLLENAWRRLPTERKTETLEALMFVETPLALGFLERVAATDYGTAVRNAAQEAVDTLSPFVLDSESNP